MVATQMRTFEKVHRNKHPRLKIIKLGKKKLSIIGLDLGS